MTDGGLPHSDMHGSQDACSYPCLFAAYRVLHRLLAPRHPPYALVHLTYLRSFAFVFANVICLNPKMLGSIHFKLIREANSFNEVRTFVLTIVSVNDKSLTAYLYGEFVFFAFLLLCSFQRSIMVGLTRLELVTSRLSGVRSNQLSYRPIYGGDEEIRTPDPLLARQVLSQLSYTPIYREIFSQNQTMLECARHMPLPR